MAKFLALEWDADELRLVSANLRGSDVVVEDATSFPFGDLVLGDEGKEEGEDSAGSLTDVLANALESQDLSRQPTTVLMAVPRSNVEVRVLQVPVVPEDELPAMVRNQALRQFSTIGEDWPLDFVTLAGNEEDEMQSVLATTISPKLVDDITETCLANHTQATSLVLRPFATGSLVQRTLGQQLPECSLIVEVLGQEADLTVLHSNQVVFMRTIRLPSDPEASVQTQAILGELRRTIAAAQNQMNGVTIEQIVLCGDSKLQQQLHTLIPQQLSLETTSVQPFDQVSLSSSLRDNLPEHPERYAALLGMLQDEADSGAHTICFLSPRKAPEPPSNLGRNTWYGAAIAACLLMAGLVWYMQLRGLDKQIRAMESESARKETFVTEGQELSDRLEEISKFTQGNVVWLDELARLSDTDKFPGADKAIANRVLMTSRTEGGGRISLELHISEQASKDLGSMVAKLKDSKHRVQDTGLKGDKRNSDYPWLLNQTITVLSESQQQEAQAAQNSSRSPSSKPRRRSAGTR